MARRPEDPTLRERSERALLDMARRSARWLDEQVAHREGGPVTRAPSAPPVRQGPTLPVARPRPAPERAAEVLPADQVQRLQAALSSIAMQVEGLVSSTASFRGLMTDRLTDYAEQVSHLMGTTVESVEEYRQTHENALRDLRRLVTERKDQQAEAYRKALAELRKSTDEQAEMETAALSELKDTVGDHDGSLRRMARAMEGVLAAQRTLLARVRKATEAVLQAATSGDQLAQLVSEGQEQLSRDIGRRLDRQRARLDAMDPSAVGEQVAAAVRLELGTALDGLRVEAAAMLEGVRRSIRREQQVLGDEVAAWREELEQLRLAGAQGRSDRAPAAGRKRPARRTGR